MDYWQPVFSEKCSSVNANENAVLGGKRSICLSTDVNCFATSYFSHASESPFPNSRGGREEIVPNTDV